MPPEFQYPNREFALWTPLALNENESRFTFDYSSIARLKQGVTLAQAQAQMSEIQAGIGKTFPPMQGFKIEVFPTLEDLVRNVRTPLYFLLGAVFCLLLIGCANLANLLVARSMSRSQELVLRAALGAGKGRLLLQSIMEVVPLVAAGGICGVILAQWMLSMLLPLLPSTMPRLEAIRIDWSVLAFAGAVLVLTAAGAAIGPALQVMRWNINEVLRESGRVTISGGAARLRGALVVSQIAAVVVLMVVSALLIRSFVSLQNVDPGFRSDNILSVHLALSEPQLRDNAAFGRFCKAIMDRVRTLPGVVSVAMVNRLPLAGGNQTGSVDFEGTDLPRNRFGALQIDSFDWRTASPDYFRTLRIPLIEGRFFEDSDTSDRPRVSIIDENTARLVWPNQSAIGKRLRIGGPNAPWFEVVGVVGHIKHDGLGVEQRPQVYWNFQQRLQPRMALAVRTSQDPKLLTTSVIAAIHEVDPEQPVYDVRSMKEVVERSLTQQWLNTALLSLFATIALVLASIGIYGVLSYSVGLRTREIGIRMALGSERGEIVWMIVRHGAALAAGGAVIGVGASLLLGRVLASLLYGVTSRDTLSFLAASCVLFVVALAASFIPARRASQVDPMVALRNE
jgi:putative ABC transport system permease protein